MPLINSKYLNIHIWKNEEPIKQLLEQVNSSLISLDKINSYKSEERIKQYLTNRLLIQKVLGDHKIVKGENNKPYVEGTNKEVSFSHNNNFTVLMVDKETCGVDIQEPTKKVLKVKSKFINSQDFCSESIEFTTLSKAWCCKEAAFKKFGNELIFLKENITIVKELLNDEYDVQVSFKDQVHNITLGLDVIENNYLSYTLN